MVDIWSAEFIKIVLYFYITFYYDKKIVCFLAYTFLFLYIQLFHLNKGVKSVQPECGFSTFDASVYQVNTIMI
jgi:hypothetical protein